MIKSLQSNFASLLLWIGVLVVATYTVTSEIPAELSDDGAFFLRYAQNTLDGQFWVWNVGEAPIWGASAPFYPLLLAIPLGFLSPLESAILIGAALYSATVLICVRSVTKHHSNVAGLAFLALFLSNASIQNWALSGMETPLTLFLLGLCCCSLLGTQGFWSTTLLAGFLVVHKMDLVAIGLLFLLCSKWKSRMQQLASLAISCSALSVWHIFAWSYFDSPLPNSFVTKFEHQILEPFAKDSGWFSAYLLLHNSHYLLLVLSIMSFALLFFKKASNHRTLYFSLGVVVIHTFVYSCFPPIEPYNWYAMPALFALVWMSTPALGNGLALLSNGLIRWGIAVASTGALLMFVIPIERIHKERWLSYRAFVERDRAEAGRWVAAHTTSDARLLTGWGNPALYAQRKTIDSSFLQTRFQRVDLLQHTKPDVIIFQGAPGTSPDHPEFTILNEPSGENYRVVKTFREGYDAGFGIYFAVLLRNH